MKDQDANNDIRPGKRAVKHKSDLITQLQHAHPDEDGVRMPSGLAERTAKQILATTLPFDRGTCEKCGGAKNDVLFPISLTICKRCCKRIIDTVGHLKVRATPTMTRTCDLCFCTALTMYVVNPRVCPTCLNKLGRLYRSSWPGKNQAARGN